MPQLVHPIDFIARQKRRDVLFVAFPELALGSTANFDQDSYLPRMRLLAFLGQHEIPWSPCAYPSDSGVLCGGTELIYLDVLLDPEDPRYRQVADHLETPDGQPQDPRVRFLYMPLAQALQIQTHLGRSDEGAQSCFLSHPEP